MQEAISSTSRRRFLQATGVGSSLAVAGPGLLIGRTDSGTANAQHAAATKVVKNICHQCPARCGIDVYVTNGRVHAILRHARSSDLER